MGEFFTHREQAKPARSLPSSAGQGRYIHESRHVCEIRCNRNSAISEPAQPQLRKAPTLTMQFVTACLVTLVSLASTAQGDEAQPGRGATPQQAQAVVSTLDAAEVLRHARQMLMKTPSLQASIQQRGRLAAGAFESSGTYRAGQFPRLRIETTTELAGLTGRSIEVCDGQVLWTERRIEGLPIDPDDEESDGTQTIVTRRDIDLIRDALANSPQTSRHVLAAELGVGGLPSLLAGLQTAFDFRASRTETGEIVLRGFWKPGMLESLKLSAKSNRVPTEVEVVFPNQSPVPERISYLRKTGEEANEILSLRFSDIRTDQSFPDGYFDYQIPDGVEVTNRTLDAVRKVESAGQSPSQ